MTEESESDVLAIRATKSKPWRWMPGMRYAVPQGPDINFKDSQTGKRSIKPGAAAFVSRISDWQKAGHDGLLRGSYEGCPKSDRWLPDLSDPTTLRCLLHLVREAWGEDAYVMVGFFQNGERGYSVRVAKDWGADHDIAYAKTEADALVLALECAP